NALSLDRLRQDDRRLIAAAASFGICLVDCLDVVPVDDEGAASESLDATSVDLEIPSVGGGPPLAEAIDVHDRDQIRQLVKPSFVESFPDRAFGKLRIAEHDPDAAARFFDVSSGERDADGYRQSL